MDLAHALAATPVRMLHAIAAARAFDLRAELRKAHLVEALTVCLCDERGFDRLIRSLTDDETAALDALLGSGRDIALDQFVARFGPVRPYRPWRVDSIREPWRDPISVTEHLLFLGLIFVVPAPDEHGDQARIVLPEEFAGQLHDDSATPPPAIDIGATETLAERHPALDVAQFVALLQQADIRPLHGRWLPLNQVRDLAARLDPPAALAGVRSELQARRICFTHYVAESLGLVGVTGGRLMPSPGSLEWLAKPPSEQLREMWDTWRADTEGNLGRWQRYRLPGARLHAPFVLVEAVLLRLSRTPLGEWQSVADLASGDEPAALSLIPWWERESDGAGADVFEEILRGPLAALGAVAIGHESNELRWALTQRGAWLVGRDDGCAPGEGIELLRLTPDLALRAPSGASPAGLLALAPWTEWDGACCSYRLTSGSVRRALASVHEYPASTGATDRRQGADQGEHPALQDLFALLATYAEPAPLPQQRAQIESWGAGARFARIERALLLEASDEEALKCVLADPDLRRFVRQVVEPETALLAGAGTAELAVALEGMGFLVRTAVPDPAAGPLDAGTAEWLAAAVLILEQLSRRLAVTAPPPGDLRSWVASQMDAGRWAAAEWTAALALERIIEAIDGPPPEPARLSVEEILTLVEQAIADGEVLRIRYWSAWQRQESEREVEPTRVEWRGDRAILVGHCRLRGGERTFRLDRIVEIERAREVG